MYQPIRPATSRYIPIRQHRYHVLEWGTPRAGQPPLVLVHGWMDVAASWQFLVDAFEGDRHIVAPDWRGYGLTEGPATDNYWFPDYLADLDLLLDAVSPDAPVHLAGHSMGGNVVMMYAGARPGRISRLINLEGFGLAATRPAQAPGRYAKWMDQLKALQRGELDLKPYASQAEVARRLMKTNHRLPEDKALWLASHWAAEGSDGLWRVRGDAAHKIANAQLFRVDEALALYQAISAPVLWIEAADNSLARWWQGSFTLAEFHERLAHVKQVDKARIDDAGHMFHHDQPGVLARLIEAFLAR